MTRPARSRSAPVELGRACAARLEAVTPAAQIDGAAGDALGRRRRRRRSSRRSSSTPTTVRSGSTRHAESLAAIAPAFAESEGGKVVSTRSAGLDEQDAGACADRRCGSRGAACRARARRSGPAISTPVGPAPTTTNVEPARSASLGSGSASAASNAREDAAADDERALERLHLGRVLAPARRGRSTSSASRRRRRGVS